MDRQIGRDRQRQTNRKKKSPDSSWNAGCSLLLCGQWIYLIPLKVPQLELEVEEDLARKEQEMLGVTFGGRGRTEFWEVLGG